MQLAVCATLALVSLAGLALARPLDTAAGLVAGQVEQQQYERPQPSVWASTILRDPTYTPLM